jgi:hypothetical protein
MVEPPGADDPRELLSAWLDGELTPDEESRVAALLETDADARAELSGLRAARAMVRELPPVEPPFGFYERMLRSGEPIARRDDRALGSRRSRRRSGGLAGLAVAAVAASFVLLAGLTPAVDRLVPPVEAFAARHEQMAVAPDLGSTIPTGSDVEAPGASAFAALPADRLDSMAPAEVDDYRRVAGYHSSDVVHLIYSNGRFVVSVYEQPGSVRWSALPEGDRMTVGADPAWATKWGEGEILVIERRSMVFTLVATAPHDEMMEVAALMPAPEQDVGVEQRLRRACEQVVDSFGLGLSDRS